MEKSEAIGELDKRHGQFRGMIADLPDEAYGEVFLGEWDLSRVLAHMAGWWREMSGAFGRVAAGERPVPEGVDYSDADPWNAEFAKQAKAGKAALDDWEDAFKQYKAAANGLDASLYGMDPEKGRLRIGNRLLAASGLDHFDEHTPQVEEWLKAR